MIIGGVSEGVRGHALDPKTAEALRKKSEEPVRESFLAITISRAGKIEKADQQKRKTQ
jgi:hypothetical protein